MSHPPWQVLALQWLSNKCHDPIISILIGPKKICIDFLIDTGAQVSVINKEIEKYLNVKPCCRKVAGIGIDGIIGCSTAKIILWLPGEKRLT